jgi:hypothetical protein
MSSILKLVTTPKIRTARKTPTFAHWRARIQAMSARQRSAGTLMLTPSPSESLTDGCTLIRNALLFSAIWTSIASPAPEFRPHDYHGDEER